MTRAITAIRKFALVFLCALGSAGAARAATVTLVEYYHAAFDHYFITAIPDEIVKLDNGTFAGWARTGQQFNAYTLGTLGSATTCRFFSRTFDPKSSHFYTPNVSECIVVKANANWQFEGDVFGVVLPDANGNCVSPNVALYRVYNNGQGAAPNHRYTISLAIRQTMLAQGWIPEGSGTLGVIACVPPVFAIGTAEGLWRGTSGKNQTIYGVVLDTGTFYFLYTSPGSNLIAGVIQGSGAAASGQFSSSNAKDFNIAGLGVYNAAIAGTYTPRASLGGAITAAYGSTTFTAVYQAVYDQPASLSAVAGTYSGQVASSAGVQNVVATVGTSGAIAGAGAGCSFSGTATPRGSVNIFNLSVTFHGGACIFGNSTLTGIAFYDAPTRTVYGAAPNASRTDGFVFIGTKP